MWKTNFIKTKFMTHTCMLFGVFLSFHRKMMAPPSDMAVKQTPHFKDLAR